MSSGGWLTNARDRDALLLATRLVREAVHLRAEADEGEDLGHLGPDLILRLSLDFERVGDVLVGRAVGEELEVLEDAADVARSIEHLAPAQAGELAAADDDPAPGRVELLEEEPHDGRLARAGRADEEDELALVDDRLVSRRATTFGS